MSNFTDTNKRCLAKGGYMRAAVKSISHAHLSGLISQCSFALHEWLHTASSPIRSNNVDDWEASLAAYECLTHIRVEQRVSRAFGECVLFKLLDVSFAFPAAT